MEGTKLRVKKLSGRGKELFKTGTADSPVLESSGGGAVYPFFIDPSEPRPPGFEVLREKYLTGEVLLRIQSKKFFRKWKTHFFLLAVDRIEFYTSKASWELAYEPLSRYQINSALTVTPLFLQTVGSVGEGDMGGVYFIRLAEIMNLSTPDEVNKIEASTANASSPGHMSEDHFKTLVKFGSKDPQALIYLSNALKRILIKEGNAMEKTKGLFASTATGDDSGIEKKPSLNDSGTAAAMGRPKARSGSGNGQPPAALWSPMSSTQQFFPEKGAGKLPLSIPPAVAASAPKNTLAAATTTTTSNAVDPWKSTGWSPFDS